MFLSCFFIFLLPWSSRLLFFPSLILNLFSLFLWAACEDHGCQQLCRVHVNNYITIPRCKRNRTQPTRMYIVHPANAWSNMFTYIGYIWDANAWLTCIIRCTLRTQNWRLFTVHSAITEEVHAIIIVRIWHSMCKKSVYRTVCIRFSAYRTG